MRSKEENKLDIVKALNEYFGTECESVNDFRHDLQELAHSHEQGWKLLDFLSWLERNQDTDYEVKIKPSFKFK